MMLKHVCMCVALSCGSFGLHIRPDQPIQRRDDTLVWHEDEESELPIDMVIREVVPIPAYVATRSNSNPTQNLRNLPIESMHWVFAAHHKAGTHLIRSLARYQRDALDVGDCENSGCELGHCSSHWGSAAPKGTRMWFSCDYNEDQYKAMQEFARNNVKLHTVHIVRDPFSLVISGYIYHMHSNDHCDAKCQRIRNMSISDGIAVESKWALNHTLVDMLRTYELGLNDTGIMTVRMEDLIKSTQDFDITIRRMYEHNQIGAFLTAEQHHTLETRAQQEDLNRHPDHDAGHQASEEMKDTAAQALQRIPQRLRIKLREVGEKLGYVYQ